MSGKQIETMDKWAISFARLLGLVVVVLLLALTIARVMGTEESNAPGVDINTNESTTFP